MAIFWKHSVDDDYIWSLEKEMFLTYTKDSSDAAVTVTIQIIQNSISKFLTLKYSGIIKEVSFDLATLIRPYFTHFDLSLEDLDFFDKTTNSGFYDQDRTLKVVVSIVDSDPLGINVNLDTTQRFIKNVNGQFKGVPSKFGGENWYNPELSTSKNFNVSKEEMFFNYPVMANAFITGVGSTQTSVKVQRYTLEDVFLDEILYNAPGVSDERIIYIPVGKGNIPLPDVSNGVKVILTTYYFDSPDWIELSIGTFIFNYAEPCDITRKKDIYFEGRYGGSEILTFANQQETIAKSSNKFTLQNGGKIELNVSNRVNGSLISEYIKEGDNEIYTSLFVSEKVQIALDSGDIEDILLTQKSHRIKQIDNSEMKQYTFAYEEVERLKY